MKLKAPKHLFFDGKSIQPGQTVEMNQDDAEAAIAEGWTVEEQNEVELENETETEDSIDEFEESEI